MNLPAAIDPHPRRTIVRHLHLREATNPNFGTTVTGISLTNEFWVGRLGTTPNQHTRLG